jgi:hypothetical protein
VNLQLSDLEELHTWSSINLDTTARVLFDFCCRGIFPRRDANQLQDQLFARENTRTARYTREFAAMQLSDLEELHPWSSINLDTTTRTEIEQFKCLLF